MAYIGQEPANSFISFEKQVFTIVNSQTAYTLSHAVTNENDIRLVINNVIQEPGSGKAYTASGTTLTLSAALVNGTDEMYCVYLGRALQTVNAPDGSISNSQVAPTIITGQTAETSIATDDTILIHDTSASALRKMTRANFVSGIGGTNTPAFQATKRDTSHQTFSTTPTKITFSNEDFDTDSMFASNRFTPTTAGKYFLYFQVLGQPNNENLEDAYLKLYKNGSAIGNYASDSQFATVDQFANGQNNSLSGSFTDTANGTGDYYEIYAYYSESFTVTDAVFGGYKLIGV
tara:strand:+ start:68 stop:937 length:870 start_codon:yes stop_codon:yes gene_type:complete